VRESLAAGEFVEDLVGDGTPVVADAFQQGADLRTGQPEQGVVGALGGGQRVAEGGEVVPDGAGVVAEQLAYALIEGAALARAGAELPGDLADRAAVCRANMRCVACDLRLC
jgi:hypothetical protein